MEELENEQNQTEKDLFEKNPGFKVWILIVLCISFLTACSYISFNVDTLYKNLQNFPKIFQSQNEQSFEGNPKEFAPYMKKLQKKIKSNWNPPKSANSNSVEILFYIAKDGRLLTYAISKSSGSEDFDNAAIDAIIKSAPFEKLPKTYKSNNVAVNFHFDHNVFKDDKQQWWKFYSRKK